MKKDITSNADIRTMVDRFYQKVQQDADLGYIFNEFVQVDWNSHLPKMYAFWEKIAFGTGLYVGRPFDPHIPLPIGRVHFEKWLAIFKSNLDESFAGSKADELKQRASNIASVFEHKLAYLNEYNQAT